MLELRHMETRGGTMRKLEEGNIEGVLLR